MNGRENPAMMVRVLKVCIYRSKKTNGIEKILKTRIKKIKIYNVENRKTLITNLVEQAFDFLNSSMCLNNKSKLLKYSFNHFKLNKLGVH